jgi:Terminase-like family.
MSDDLTDYEYLQNNPSAFVENIIGIEPFGYQKQFMDHDSDRKVFVAGRQVGKSRTASWMALHYAVTHPDSLVLVTADALRQSSELFSQLQSEINNSGLADEQWGIERSTQTEIEFAHNSRIKVVPTGRNGNKIRGFTADLIIIDEAAFVANSIFEEVIEPMTLVSKGTIVLTSTPYGASGYFYEKAQKAEIADTDWHKMQVASSDNPLIETSDIERLKRGKTRNQIKQEVEGEFIPTGDQFFPNPLIKKTTNDDVRRGVIQYASANRSEKTDPNPRTYMGADLGAEGTDETVLTMLDEYGNVFSIERHNIGVYEARKRIQQLDNHYGFEGINVDRTGIGEGPVAELQQKVGNKVTPVYLSTQKKQSVYQTMKSRMESGMLDLPANKDIRLQLEKLGYSKTKTGNLSIHAKGSFHDDIPDSIALGVWALPDAGGGGRSAGAGGMTQIKTIGGLQESDGTTRYQFGSDGDDDDELRRFNIKSN